MKRFHALEWADLDWFPSSWRDYGTDYLQFIAVKFDIYKPIIPILQKGLEASQGQEWVDCAAGGGGGLLKLSAYMKADYPQLKIHLTDFRPNIQAFEQTVKTAPADVFDYEKASVDARDLPAHLHGKFRTLFAAFHHFRPDDARQILQNAVNSRSPIAIFEPVGRNFPSFFSMLFVILNVLILTPFIRPLRLSTLPFIYLLPIIPLYIMWDGIASIFRVYSEKEMQDLVNSLENGQNFDWEIGRKQSGPMPMYYLLGTPKK